MSALARLRTLAAKRDKKILELGKVVYEISDAINEARAAGESTRRIAAAVNLTERNVRDAYRD